MKNILIIIFYNILSIFSCSELIKPKFCVNCKYFIKNYFAGNKFGKCSLLPIEIEDNDFLVDGSRENKKMDYNYCSIARQYDNMCGKEGKLYEKSGK